MIDNVVVGAGVAGCVIANRLAQKNQKVLIIEKRNKIGGQAHDSYNSENILIHDYGPHIFHTDSEKVYNFLSNFTGWHIYNHEVLGFVDNSYIPIPFNINSLNKVFPEKLAKKYIDELINTYGYNKKITIWDLRNSDNKDLNKLAKFIYNKIFLNYTLKQWERSPENLDKNVTSRVPVNISKDNRYFYDKYQMIPDNGYTKMFKKMINHENINLILNTDFKKILTVKNDLFKIFNSVKVKRIFYTAPIDYLFDFEYGELPYRSLNFKFEIHKQKYYQQKGVINYPNSYNFTRITEFKHITSQKNQFTTIAKEYPQKCSLKKGDTPYYPIPQEKNRKLYNKYARKAKSLKNFYTVGRLADYKYLNMTQTIEKALRMVKKL